MGLGLLRAHVGAERRTSTWGGDEVALEGGNDPDNRRCFPWAELDARGETLAHFKRLSELRRELPELRRGGFEPWLVGRDGRVLCYQRGLGRTSTLVVLNLSDAPQEVDLPASRTRWRNGQVVHELLGQRKLRVTGTKVSLPLRPWEAMILR